VWLLLLLLLLQLMLLLLQLMLLLPPHRAPSAGPLSCVLGVLCMCPIAPPPPTCYSRGRAPPVFLFFPPPPPPRRQQPLTTQDPRAQHQPHQPVCSKHTVCSLSSLCVSIHSRL